MLGDDSSNPYNPYGLNSEFKINSMGNSHFMEMRDSMKKQYPKLPLDQDMLVFEGCEQDDKIILGGKNAFL